MTSGPDLHYTLTARSPGSFGSSLAGRVAETLTLTWFRFEVTLAWLLFAPFLIFSSSEDFGTKILMAAFSPIIAVVFWATLKSAGWVFYFLPGIGRVWGWGRIVFLWMFSKLVVQPAPGIDLPAWGFK